METIAASLNEEAGTIEEIYEPYLMKVGFLKRTPRGRVVTDKLYSHLNIHRDKYKQQSL